MLSGVLQIRRGEVFAPREAAIMLLAEIARLWDIKFCGGNLELCGFMGIGIFTAGRSSCGGSYVGIKDRGSKFL